LKHLEAVVGALAVSLLVSTTAACGLKGPLSLPEKSKNVVIRGPAGDEVPAPAPTTTAPDPASTRNPTATPSPKDERMPPPPLPGGNTGGARGG
jgi:predicted small lipoprotein YifL